MLWVRFSFSPRVVNAPTLALALLLPLATGAQPTAAVKEIWYRYGLASVMTGRLSDGTPVGENLYVVALGPATGIPDAVELRIRAQNAKVIPNLISRLSEQIDRT